MSFLGREIAILGSDLLKISWEGLTTLFWFLIFEIFTFSNFILENVITWWNAKFSIVPSPSEYLGFLTTFVGYTSIMRGVIDVDLAVHMLGWAYYSVYWYVVIRLVLMPFGFSFRGIDITSGEPSTTITHTVRSRRIDSQGFLHTSQKNQRSEM